MVRTTPLTLNQIPFCGDELFPIEPCLIHGIPCHFLTWPIPQWSHIHICDVSSPPNLVQYTYMEMKIPIGIELISKLFQELGADFLMLTEVTAY